MDHLCVMSDRLVHLSLRPTHHRLNWFQHVWSTRPVIHLSVFSLHNILLFSPGGWKHFLLLLSSSCPLLPKQKKVFFPNKEAEAQNVQWEEMCPTTSGTPSLKTRANLVWLYSGISKFTAVFSCTCSRELACSWLSRSLCVISRFYCTWKKN